VCSCLLRGADGSHAATAAGATADAPPPPCRALGCLLPSCQLCKHNPSRRCAVNFDKKYLVNDVLKAKCQAVIRVEIVERTTNMPIEAGDLRDDMVLQMAILDGNTYDAKFEAGLENDFEACLLLMNNKARRRCPPRASATGLRRRPLQAFDMVLCARAAISVASASTSFSQSL
jgi:hypothetical protein